MTPSLKFRASLIRKSGDIVNDAVISWSSAPAILDGAALPPNCFGEIGEKIGLRDDYERSRAETILKLSDGTAALIQNREAVYRAANRYEHAEHETTHEVGRIPGHRPEIDNDRGDYESQYGWARDDE